MKKRRKRWRAGATEKFVTADARDVFNTCQFSLPSSHIQSAFRIEWNVSLSQGQAQGIIHSDRWSEWNRISLPPSICITKSSKSVNMYMWIKSSNIFILLWIEKGDAIPIKWSTLIKRTHNCYNTEFQKRKMRSMLLKFWNEKRRKTNISLFVEKMFMFLCFHHHSLVAPCFINVYLLSTQFLPC